MSGSSGRGYSTLWTDCDLDGWSLRTHRGLLPGFPPSSVDLPPWGSWDDMGVSPLTPSGPAIVGNGYSSLLRTPNAAVTEPKSSVTKLSGRRPSDPQVGLADQVVALLPTLDTAQGRTPAIPRLRKRRPNDSAIRTAEIVMALLPTPSASQGGYNQSESPGAAVRPQLPMLVRELLPTPTAGDAKSSRNHAAGRSDPDSEHHDGITLTDALRLQLLPTPRASDSNGAGAHGSGGADLWTVVAEASRSGDELAFDWGVWQPAIDRHAVVLGRPAPWPVVDGTRSLSGDFTEWMMTLPEGWLEGISNAAKRRVCGNAVVPAQATVALSILTGEVDK